MTPDTAVRRVAPALVLLVASCRGPGYTIPGPSRLEANPPIRPLEEALRVGSLARPPSAGAALDLSVWPKGVLDADAAGEAGGVPAEAAPEGRSEEARLPHVTSHAPLPATWGDRWVLRLDVASVGRVTFHYRPPGGTPLPVLIGERLQLSWWAESPRDRYTGPVLVLRNPEGDLVAALADGGGLPRSVLGEDLRVSASQRLAYTEVHPLASDCLTTTMHRLLTVRARDETGQASQRTYPPGIRTEIAHEGRRYELIVIDAAEPRDDGPCRDRLAGRLSFALLATRRFGAPEAGAIE